MVTVSPPLIPPDAVSSCDMHPIAAIDANANTASPIERGQPPMPTVALATMLDNWNAHNFNIPDDSIARCGALTPCRAVRLSSNRRRG